jgi:N-acetylglucosaminyldiphosphoundecaprenol N-acetyl-beta-D-mannosaminyltransferase
MIQELINAGILNVLNQKEYLMAIEDSLNSSSSKTFSYLNSQSYYLLNRSEEFKRIFSNFDYVIPDGYSIVLAAKKVDKIKIEKVVFTYSFFDYLADFFSKRKIKIFFLGSKSKTISKAVELIKCQFPELIISGFADGYFKENDEDKTIAKINSSGAEVLIVGMGIPKSEYFIQRNKSQLIVKCVFSVGGFFDFAANEKNIAPTWLYNSGFEWVHRVIQEPIRLWKRYLICNSYFIVKVLSNIFKH